MNEEQLNIAIMAINRWIYCGWNFVYKYHTWENIHGEMVSANIPRFLIEADWHCTLDYMIDKWERACSCNNGDAYFTTFYASLDNTNRIAFIKWVMNHYTDECKLL